MKTIDQNQAQLELTLEQTRRRCPTTERRLHRRRRAHLWFQHMRQIVDGARDWPAAQVPQDSRF